MRASRWSGEDAAQRTARLADQGWVLPWGLARQVDPGSGAFVPRLAGEGLRNRTGRRWTLVGPAGGASIAVDPAGLVTPRLGAWSIDWWVGADDRWRLPSREPSVRQTLVGSAPVVETSMRVPGGDAVHRCFGVPGSLVLEVENRSPTPFALVFCIRPLDPLGATAAGSVAVEGDRVLVDGRTALRLPSPPGRAAASTGAGGDVAATVLAGRASSATEPATCAEELASIAVLLPVAHRTALRAVLPLDGGSAAPAALPSVDAAVRGWHAHGRRGLGTELPDPALQAAFDASRLHLLAGDDDEAPAEEAAVVVAALSRLGRHVEAGNLVRSLWARQRTDGSFDEPGGRGAPGGPHLWALGEHLGRSRDAALAGALDGGMVAAEGWLRELEAAGQLAPPARRWAIDGRCRAAVAAGDAGLAAAAEVLLSGARRSRGGATRLPTPPATARTILGLCFGDPARSGRPAVRSPAGFDLRATLAAAASDVCEREPGVVERLGWLLRAGGPTSTWPDHLHPATGDGSDGSGASRVALAAFLLVTRDLLTTEPEPGRVHIVPVLPPAWRGQPLEVRDAVLGDGAVLSFAIRWHGRRPALLWEADAPIRLAAPGLDPSFDTTDPRGEVLLAETHSTDGCDDGTVELT